MSVMSNVNQTIKEALLPHIVCQCSVCKHPIYDDEKSAWKDGELIHRAEECEGDNNESI